MAWPLVGRADTFLELLGTWPTSGSGRWLEFQARSPQGWGACHGWPIIQCVLLVPSWLSRTRIVTSFSQRSFCPTTCYRSGALGIRSLAKCPANFNTTIFLLMLPNTPDSGNVQWDQKMIHPVCILAIKRHQGWVMKTQDSPSIYLQRLGTFLKILFTLASNRLPSIIFNAFMSSA